MNKCNLNYSLMNKSPFFNSHGAASTKSSDSLRPRPVLLLILQQLVQLPWALKSNVKRGFAKAKVVEK